MQLVVGGPITTKMPMEAAAEVAVAVETETREIVRDAHSEEDEVGEVLVILEEEEGEVVVDDSIVTEVAAMVLAVTLSKVKYI